MLMADAPPSPDKALDVDDRDGQRSPMQWDETGEGFGGGEQLFLDKFGDELRVFGASCHYLIGPFFVGLWVLDFVWHFDVI